MNTPTENYSRLPSIRSSPVVLVFHKSLQNNIRSSENPLEPWLLKFLLACLMVNPITLVVLLTFLVIIIFESVDSICLRMHAIIIDPYKLLLRLSCHSFNWNWFSTNPIVVDCTIRLFNLSIPNQSIASDPLIWKS